MTTQNHTAIAVSVALIAQNADSLEKVGIVTLLALSHLPADAIPHGHYYEFAKFRQTWPGAILELGFGLIGLPLLVWYLTRSSLSWLFVCTIAASFFDFLVAFEQKFKIKIGMIKFNHWLHWWDKNLQYPHLKRWAWEIGQTTFLLIFLYLSVVKYG